MLYRHCIVLALNAHAVSPCVNTTSLFPYTTSVSVPAAFSASYYSKTLREDAITDILILLLSAFLQVVPGTSPGNARATAIYHLSEP
jgi:hypothetical protein